MRNYVSDNREVIIAAIRKAGYNYAKEQYQEWVVTFAEELMDESSYYYKSVDKNGNPLKEIFEEQIYEQAYHSYCDGTTDDFFNEFHIEGFSKEERDSLEDEYLFDYLEDGISDFIKENYN